MVLLLCTLLVLFCFLRGGLVSVDQTICKTVRAVPADRMPPHPANLGLPVCLFIHQGVFDLLPQRRRLPLRNFLLYCIAAEPGVDVITGLHVLPSYAHTRLFMGVCVGRNDSGGFEMPYVARMTEREGNTFRNCRPTLFLYHSQSCVFR